MNVLFLTLAYPEDGERNIYTDLMDEFRDRGEHVFVVCQRERRSGKSTELCLENGIQVLRVRIGNVTKTNKFEKALSTLLLEKQFLKSIKKYLAAIKFDLILYSTPPVTFDNVVRNLKSRDGSTSYLLLKDIFPQNAVDIGLMKKGSLIWKYFRKVEQRLYAISDHIGCMSPANVKYLLQHNQEINSVKVEECPNSIRPAELNRDTRNLIEIRSQYGIPEDSVVFVYGGNLGIPQGIDFLLNLIEAMKDREDVFFLIVGSGTEFARIERFMRARSPSNAKLIKSLPKTEFDQLLSGCDVGMIFLDPRFTIPNFPSRMTAYMEYGLPIAAATDIHSDVKDLLRDSNCGMWAENGDLSGFVRIIDEFAKNDQLRYEMGMNGRHHLEQYYTTSRSYEIIAAHIKNDGVGTHVHR